MTNIIGIGGLIRLALIAATIAIASPMLSTPAAAASGTTCPPGYVQAEAGKCMPAGAQSCGGGDYCNPGSYCSSLKGKCVHNGDIDCHDGHACAPGFACAPGGGCIDPHAPARNSSSGSGCGSDITGTGGGSQRTNCSPAQAQVIQQRVQRQDLRRKLLSVPGVPQGGQTASSYSYSYGYTSSQPVYREDPQVIYEKVKQRCGATPTNDCAVGVINQDGTRRPIPRKLSYGWDSSAVSSSHICGGGL